MTIETIPMFLLGGAGYVGIELLYRGRSHISMFLAGGVLSEALSKLSAGRLRRGAIDKALKMGYSKDTKGAASRTAPTFG